MKKLSGALVRAICLLLCFLTLIPSVSALTPPYTPSESYRNGSYYTALAQVELTGDQRADFVNIARSQIGYHESSDSSNLSGTTQGSRDYTEYGYWYGSQDLWCAMFVSWCAAQAGISTDTILKEDYTVNLLNHFKVQGRAYPRDQVKNGVYVPQPGDLIFFKFSRNKNETNHVGIISDYHDGVFYTIEGNTNSQVSSNGQGVYEHTYSIDSKYVVYICSPAFAVPEPEPEPAVSSCGPFSSLAKLIGAQAASAFRDLLSAATGSVAADQMRFPACGSGFTSIVSALNSIGAPSDFAYRASIAQANNIPGYTGSAAQNIQLLDLLAAGQLIKP